GAREDRVPRAGTIGRSRNPRGANRRPLDDPFAAGGRRSRRRGDGFAGGRSDPRGGSAVSHDADWDLRRSGEFRADPPRSRGAPHSALVSLTLTLASLKSEVGSLPRS